MYITLTERAEEAAEDVSPELQVQNVRIKIQVTELDTNDAKYSYWIESQLRQLQQQLAEEKNKGKASVTLPTRTFEKLLDRLEKMEGLMADGEKYRARLMSQLFWVA